MKIDQTTLAGIERALFDTLAAHNLHPFMVQTDRHAWDVFHKAWQERRLDGNALYRHYNDAHIQTALRFIFKRVRA